MFVLKLSDGRVQSIEGDRIRTPDSGLPDGMKKSDFTHGVQVRKGGLGPAIDLGEAWALQFPRD